MPEFEDETGRLQEIAPIGTRRYGAGQRIAIASTQSTTADMPDNIDEVLLHASARCFVLAVTGAGTVSNVTGIPLETGEKFHMQLRNDEKIAVIRDTADGWLNIVPVI